MESNNYLSAATTDRMPFPSPGVNSSTDPAASVRTTMRAIRVHQFGGPEVLVPERVPLPSPAAGEVLLKVRLAAINGADLNLRAGRHTVQRHGFTGHPVSRASNHNLPITLGMEVCGEIVTTGEHVPVELLGRRVMAFPMLGGYAEYVVCPITRVFFPPPELADEQAAASGISFFTAHFMLRERVKLQPQETVLITVASGATGVVITQLALQIGARVIAVVSRPAKARMLEEVGLDARNIVDLSAEDLAPAVRKRTNGSGVDVLLDAVGGSSFAELLPLGVQGGRIVLYGNLSSAPASIDATRLITAQHTLLGFSLITYLSRAEYMVSAVPLLWESLGRQGEGIHVPVGQCFPLEQAADAHASIQKRLSMGKTLLRVS